MVNLQVPLVPIGFPIYLDEHIRSAADLDGLSGPCHLQLRRGHFQRDRPDGDLRHLLLLVLLLGLRLRFLSSFNSARFVLRPFRTCQVDLGPALP